MIFVGCGEELILPPNGTVNIKSPAIQLDYEAGESCSWIIRSVVHTSHILVKNTDYRVVCENEFRIGIGDIINVSSTYHRWEFRRDVELRIPADFSVPSSIIWMSVKPVFPCFVVNGSRFAFEFSNSNERVAPYCEAPLFQCVDKPFECVHYPCDGNAVCNDQSDELGLHCRE